MAGRGKINMMISITQDERKALKQMALDHDTTVSALLCEWLREHQGLEQALGGPDGNALRSMGRRPTGR